MATKKSTRPEKRRASHSAIELANSVRSLVNLDPEDFPILELCTCQRGDPCAHPETHGKVLREPPLLTPDERDERTRKRLAARGDIPDSWLHGEEWEFTGPDGAIEGARTPPLSTQEIIGRLEQKAEQAAAQIALGQETGGSRRTSKETAEQIALNVEAVDALDRWADLPKARTPGRVATVRNYLATVAMRGRVGLDVSDSRIKKLLRKCDGLRRDRKLT